MDTKNTPNFQRIVRDLLKAGWTTTAIADHVGISQQAISRIKIGKATHIRYENGAALIELHNKEMPKYEVRRKGPKSVAGSE